MKNNFKNKGFINAKLISCYLHWNPIENHNDKEIFIDTHYLIMSTFNTISITLLSLTNTHRDTSFNRKYSIL